MFHERQIILQYLTIMVTVNINALSTSSLPYFILPKDNLSVSPMACSCTAT